MDWKKFGLGALFPPMGLLLPLLPTAAACLVYAMTRLEQTDPVRIGSYVLAFYTLIVWCARVPEMIRRWKKFKNKNPYAGRWLGDPRLRLNVTLLGNVLWNGAYAALQLGLGIYHKSPWFYSLAAYYCSLAGMRAYLLGHSLGHAPGEDMARELRRYRTCGWVFLVMNLALSAMIFYMICENRMVKHHEITTITLAAYTFTSMTMAIVNVIKYRKLGSPVFSASKAISLASACVSMLTLEGTMLATFQRDGMSPGTQVLFLALTGGAISALIIAMAVYMILRGGKKIQSLETEYGT